MTAPTTAASRSSADVAAAAHHAAQQALSQAARAKAAALWARATAAGGGLVAGYVAVLPLLVQLVAAAQLLAASRADAYVNRALPGDPRFLPRLDERVDAAMLAGVAADGRGLESLLRTPLYRTVHALAEGFDYDEAVAFGEVALSGIVLSEVLDAGRVADGIATVTHGAAGYYRRLTPPSCARCVILAGKWFRFNQGFQRHPACDCVHVPAAEIDYSSVFDPNAYFDSLDETEQDRVFTKAGAEAIRQGADMSQVVNARRGVRTASVGGRDVRVTTEGVTRRGWYGHLQRQLDGAARFTRDANPAGTRYRHSAKPRLMPEQIFALQREEGFGRDELVRLLKRNGYFLDGDAPGEHPLARVAADVLGEGGV